MPPTRLGPLALETRLGDHPSLSRVWRAVHVDRRRSLAVKTFDAPLGATPEARRRLADEWTRLQKLSHPAIVKCYGGGFEGSTAYLAYEWIDGETLSMTLQHRGRLSWEQTLDLGESIAGGLAYLHDAGIPHGAVVPSKILLAGLSPVLIDPRVQRFDTPFRSSRPPDPAEIDFSPPESRRGPAGTPAATSPTVAGDLYSLAAVMYACVTGRTPTAGSGAASDDVPPSIPPPSSIVTDVPVWIDRLLMPMLSADPAGRPPTATAVGMQIEETRRRCWSRTSVIDATSRGFSPLDAGNQDQRREARTLLGQSASEDTTDHSGGGLLLSGDDPHAPWYQSSLTLFLSLMAAVAFAAYMLWPLSEDQMQRRAESLLAEGTRASLSRARHRYLEPMIDRYPAGRHTDWAEQQIERIDMAWAENALRSRVKKNLPLSNEGERLLAEAMRYEQFGDRATALARYRSLVTLMRDEPKYRAYVNLAKRQIAVIESQADAADGGEAMQLVREKLEQSDRLAAGGQIIAAQKILHSIVELYGNNRELRPVVDQAMDRLATARTR